jgi:RNA polymerase sigma-70 factor (ECF subfamily)
MHTNAKARETTPDTTVDGQAMRRQLVELIPELRIRARFLMRDVAMADDLVQDVLERAMVAEDRFRMGTNLRAWLHVIMRNLATDSQRRIMRVVDPDDLVQPPFEPSSAADVLSMDDIKHALSCLKRADREIFSLAYVEGCSYHQISAIHRIPIGTVATRLRRVKKRLRPALTAILRARQQARVPRALTA